MLSAHSAPLARPHFLRSTPKLTVEPEVCFTNRLGKTVELMFFWFFFFHIVSENHETASPLQLLYSLSKQNSSTAAKGHGSLGWPAVRQEMWTQKVTG